MQTITPSEARAELFPLIASVDKTGPVRICGRRASAILVSEEEWGAVQETAFINASPKIMRDIEEAERTPRSKWTRVR